MFMNDRAIQIGTNMGVFGSIFVALSTFLLSSNSDKAFYAPASFLFIGGISILIASCFIFLESITYSKEESFVVDIATHIFLIIGIGLVLFSMIFIFLMRLGIWLP